MTELFFKYGADRLAVNLSHRLRHISFSEQTGTQFCGAFAIDAGTVAGALQKYFYWLLPKTSEYLDIVKWELFCSDRRVTHQVAGTSIDLPIERITLTIGLGICGIGYDLKSGRDSRF